MFPKRRRIENSRLINKIKDYPCLVCGAWPTDPDHITSRGAGGDDCGDNVWPLCREHHSERHRVGIQTFAEKYERAKSWLREHDRYDVLRKEYYNAKTRKPD